MIYDILEYDPQYIKEKGIKFNYLKVVRGKESKEQAIEKLGSNKYITNIEVNNKFISFEIDWKKVFKDFSVSRPKKKNEKILLEHTSVNPNALPHIGRGRNSIIGSTLANAYRVNGYDVEVQYYVNDIGKQVAMLVYGVKEGNIDELDPEELLKIYVDINKNLDENKEKEVIELLEKFEKNDPKVRELFRKVVNIALKAQIELFKRLNVKFDSFVYESDFLEDCEKLIKEIKEKPFVINENGSIQIKFEDIEKPLVLTRETGVSLYPLRDLVYHIYKIKNYNLCYGVYGADHKLHFEQLTRVLKYLGYDTSKLHFIFYEYVLLPEGKMSTRKGNVVLLSDFLEKVKEKILSEMKKRGNIDEDTAEKVSVACVRYSIGKIDPNKKVIFDIEKETKLNGDTGVYILYSFVRLKNILNKIQKENTENYSEDFELTNIEKELSKKISFYSYYLKESLNKPHVPYIYLKDISDIFNKFYEQCRVVDEEDENKKIFRIKLLKELEKVYLLFFEICGIDPITRI